MTNDNPFAEPDDSDRTIIRPVPGGRRPAARPPAPPPPVSPAYEPPPPEPGSPGVPLRVGISPLTAAAAPLLALLSRLRNTASQPDAGELRERAMKEMRRFEQSARDADIGMDQLRPAHYALCASLDDVVLATPWGNQSAWSAGSLSATFHQEVRSGARFFGILNQLKQQPGTYLPVLELMYLCLSLGFQGQYRLSPRGPAELERIREDTYALITRQRPRPPAELSPHWEGANAPYVPLRPHLPVWVAAAGAAAIAAVFYAIVSFGLNGRSDALFARMTAAPPAAMPAILRASVAPPPPPPPAPAAEPGKLDALRTFLKPEIDQGLVTVTGTDAVPIVRIRNRGLFASGSASLQPRYVPLLERIGAALADERGAVLVVGYTDNQPIRTLQFPSNFQLSAARAKAASDVIARRMGDPSRLQPEGRADAEPIASNATPEGREENRRIEVVLRRES